MYMQVVLAVQPDNDAIDFKMNLSLLFLQGVKNFTSPVANKKQTLH